MAAKGSLVLLPSLGRGADDFDDLAMRLANAGYQTLCPQPRSLGASSGGLESLTLHDFAADIIAVIERFGGSGAELVVVSARLRPGATSNRYRRGTDAASRFIYPGQTQSAGHCTGCSCRQANASASSLF